MRFGIRSRLEAIGQHRLDARHVGLQPVRQWVTDERHQPAARFLVGGVAFRTVQMRDIGLLGLNEGIIKRLRNPRIFLQYVGLYRNQPVDRIDTGAPEPVGFSWAASGISSG